MKRNLLLLLLAACVVSLTAIAQPTGQRPGQGFGRRGQGGNFEGRPQGGVRPQSATPEQIAKQRTDMTAAELGLTEKQHKQVYKIYLKQTRKAQAARESSYAGGPSGFGADGPSGGMRGGMGMDGPGWDFGGGDFGGGMGGGMRPGGGMGGPGGQRPGGEQMGSQRPNGPLSGAMAGGFYDESEKDIAAREKKMRKILSPEQFARWQRMDSELRRDQFRRQFDRDVLPAMQ